MDVITIALIFTVLVVTLWIVNSRAQLNATLRTVINIVIVLALVVFVLQLLGFWHYIAGAKVP